MTGSKNTAAWSLMRNGLQQAILSPLQRKSTCWGCLHANPLRVLDDLHHLTSFYLSIGYFPKSNAWPYRGAKMQQRPHQNIMAKNELVCLIIRTSSIKHWKRQRTFETQKRERFNLPSSPLIYSKPCLQRMKKNLGKKREKEQETVLQEIAKKSGETGRNITR